MEPEEQLAGGNMGPVSRRGGVVLRTAGDWTPAVHRLLRHCRERGLTGVPEPLGIEPDGREVIGFLDGTVPAYPMPAWVWAEDVLASSARLLRDFHRASVDADRSGPWRSPVREPAEVICHNDFAPYNLVYSDQRATGIIDFDYASPGPRIWDLAYLAYRVVPLTTDRTDGFSDTERDARLTLLLDTYADADGHRFTRAAVLETVIARLKHLAAFSDEKAGELANPALAEHATLYRTDANLVRELI